MRPASLVMAAGVLATLACAEGDRSGPAGETAVSRPGLTLFERLGDAEVERVSETNLPGRVRQVLATPLERQRHELPDEAWAGPVPRGDAESVLPGLLPALFREAEGTPVLEWSLELQPWWNSPTKRRWLYQQGRELLPVTSRRGGMVPTDTVAFVDMDAGMVFFWGETRLRSFGLQPPRDVALEFDGQAPAGVERYDAGAGPDGGPPDVDDLVHAVTEDDITRRALVLPAPGAVRVPLGRLEAAALSFGVLLVDHAWVEQDRLLVRRHDAGDGVEVTLQAIVDGGPPCTLWTEPVTPGSGHRRRRLDLGELRGRDVTLRLVTGPGVDGDKRFDYAAFTELRLLGREPAPPTRPHVVLVDVDTLRADRLGCYGAERDTTPRLDAWAARRAEVFLRSVAVSSWTLPSTISMLTGVQSHQIPVVDEQLVFPEGVPSLPERLREAGYETLAWTDRGVVDVPFGFHRGFDRFEVRRRSLEAPDAPDWRGIPRLMAQRRHDRPLFVFLQTYMVHTPYFDGGRFPRTGGDETAWLSEVPVTVALLGEASPAARLEADRLYDEGVARMDGVVGAFLEELETALAGDPVLVIVTSDHGEELFERGAVGHGHQLHAEVTRVPLLVAWPSDGSGPPPTGVRRDPASGIDLVPTILDVVGLGVPPELPGRSLRRRAEEARPLLMHQHLPDQESFALRVDDWKLMLHEDPREETGGALGPEDVQLYRLGADRRERQDLARSRAAEAAALLDVLRRELDRAPELSAPSGAGGGLDVEAFERLRELGYVEDG